MGKKIIRLTESDLIRLVKRVIQEEDNMDNTNNHKLVEGCLKNMTGVVEWIDNDELLTGKYKLEMLGNIKPGKTKKPVNRIYVTSQIDPLKYSVVFFLEKTKGKQKPENSRVVSFTKEEIKDKKNFCETVNTRIFSYLDDLT